MPEPAPLASNNNSTQPSAQNGPATGNLAVVRCLETYERAFKARLAKDGNQFSAATYAGRLYRAAMPAPSGRDGIRDFIACVAHGVLIGAIDAKDSKVLLYAAQVAQSALRDNPATKASEPPKAAVEN
jgi:hypothetical protein